MSNSCISKCIFCEDDQVAKINFTLRHGVCENHQHSLSAFLPCSHCLNIIPVNIITCRTYCEDCSKLTFQDKYQCGHSFCLACKTEETDCKKCDFSYAKCDGCNNNATTSIPECGHKLCIACYAQIKPCIACENICKSCKKPEKTFRFKKCQHNVCERCAEACNNSCPVCPRTCDACRVNIL